MNTQNVVVAGTVISAKTTAFVFKFHADDADLWHTFVVGPNRKD